jgi:general secretion pathway protein I
MMRDRLICRRPSLPGVLRVRVRSIVAHNWCGASRASARHLRAGFTLVEVITAIAILSIALGSLMTMIGNALRQTGQADRMAEAGSLAQSLLARLGPELPLGERQDTGQFADGFHWRLNSQRFGDAGDRQQWPMSAYKISVEVDWHDGFRERSFVLTSLRLGPKEAER